MSNKPLTSNAARPELFSKDKPLQMKTTRLGARIPDGWVSNPEYLGPERRDGERRDEPERREFSRLGDGRVQRRRSNGRRDGECNDSLYSSLYTKL